MAIKQLITGVCVALAAGVLWYALSMTQNIGMITVGGISVAVDIADTDALREQGLSGRDTLPEGKGMLFVFEQDNAWGIWMKDMRFPIDIIWADGQGRVITIADSIAPGTYPEIFYPSAPARYVLELPAGFAAAHGIAVGSKLEI